MTFAQGVRKLEKKEKSLHNGCSAEEGGGGGGREGERKRLTACSV